MEHKSYIIKRNKTANQWEIHHTGKGSLPNSLSGLFTSIGYAKKAIDSYVEPKHVELKAEK